MSGIRETFERLRATGRKAFVPFLPAGFPDPATSGKLIAAVSRAGADILELGVPFSDSLADGPTIQRAYHQAIAQGVDLAKVLSLVERARRRPGSIPVVLMCAYNIIHKAGHRGFARALIAAGVDGVLAPDLPYEEGAELRETLQEAGIDLVSLLAPTTPLPRARKIARESQGFLYYISRKGTTGVRGALSGTLEPEVAALKAAVRLPVVVGFGISTPAQAAEVARYADGVVVGSALVERLRVPGSARGDRVAPVADLCRRIRRALDTV